MDFLSREKRPCLACGVEHLFPNTAISGFFYSRRIVESAAFTHRDVLLYY
jgi:hypothetical protein